MVRFNVNQSLWKNSEDEILKASVMKYGLNQWGRIASLFAKRTAKQCKARWDEWLDPHIKKTEWSREEDEKLLHLAKLMPTQWRTIAPIVGRTASQCLERYEGLLDSAGGIEDGGEEKKRVAQAETMPAKPDATDMDEEELEMLSEARARLANTLGKKSKRKARERMLEEQKRLAMIQKRRELKAAGIAGGEGKKRKRRLKNSDVEVIDYTQEVPFERLVPKGPFDVKAENRETVLRARDEEKRIKALQQVFEEKKKHKNKTKDGTEKSVALATASLVRDRKRLEEALAISRGQRAAMALPAPLVSDMELEEVAKASFDGDGVSSTSSRFAVPALPSSRRRDDVIAQEARNQIVRNTGQGQIEGKGTGFQSALPTVPDDARSKLASLASRRTFAGANGRSVILRDTLGINRPAGMMPNDDEFLEEDAEGLASARSLNLGSALKSIPQPEYEYSIKVQTPDDHEDENVDTEEADGAGHRGVGEKSAAREGGFEEDARDRDRKRQRTAQDRAQTLLEQRPTAAKMGLNVSIAPLATSKRRLLIEGEPNFARRLILEEMEQGLLEGTSRSIPMDSCPELLEIVVPLESITDDLNAVFANEAESQDAIKHRLQTARLSCETIQATCAKIRQALQASHYAESQTRAETAITAFHKTVKELRRVEHQVSVWTWMHELEVEAAIQRLAEVRGEVDALSSIEADMQKKWSELNGL